MSEGVKPSLICQTSSRGGQRRVDMDVMTYSDALAQLKGVMDRAIHDKQEVVVTRKKGEAVVVVSLDTWNAVNHLAISRL